MFHVDAVLTRNWAKGDLDSRLRQGSTWPALALVICFGNDSSGWMIKHVGENKKQLLEVYMGWNRLFLLISCLFTFGMFASGCAVQRNMVLPPLESLPPQITEDNPTISTQNYSIELKSSEEKHTKYDKKALEDSFQKRLQQHFSNAGVKPDNSGVYDFQGTMLVSEKTKTNGLVVPQLIVGIGLMPIGLLFMPLFPSTDYYYSAEATVKVVDTRDQSVLLAKQFKKDVVKINPIPFKANYKNAESSTNMTYMKTADDLMKQCVEQVAKTIKYRRKQDTAAMPSATPLAIRPSGGPE